jgi:alpha-L-arabinofuranosidase
VNPRDGHDLTVDCTIAGMNAFKPLNATAQILHHPDLNAANTFDNPDAVIPKPHAINTEGSVLKVGVPGLTIVTAAVRLG